MPCTIAGRILVAGHISPSTFSTLKQIEREGCAFQSVDTIAEAKAAVRATRFDIVLACEIMPDGRGYDLTDCAVRSSASLLVSILLSETCLWIEVVQHGVRMLGKGALNAHLLKSEIAALLNEKAVHTDHLVAPSLYAFPPHSTSQQMMAQHDQRTGPQERRALVFQAASKPKALLRSHAKGKGAKAGGG